MSYTYSLFERALIYGPEFIAGVAAVLVLAAAAMPGAAAGSFREKTYKTAVALIFTACAFVFLYAFKNSDIIYGIPVSKARLLLLAVGACLFALLINPDKGEAGPYVLCLSALASAQTAFISDPALLVPAAFIVMDCAAFAEILMKKENREYAGGLMPAKLVYALACAVFAGLFLASGGKNQKMAQAGCGIFMILFSNPGLLALRGNDGEAGEKFLHKNSSLILFSGIITGIIAAQFLSMAPQPAARPVVAALVILGSVNIYRTITEEKYQAFSAHDSINPVFLLPALVCGADLPQAMIILPAILFMLSVFMQNEFIAFHDHGRHTVASLKYGFERVKGGWLALFGIACGLAAEISVFILFYRYLKKDPFIFAAVIFMALAFSVSMLNKLFMVFSMLKRFKFNLKPEAVFNKGNIRPAVFAAFVAAVLAAWLK